MSAVRQPRVIARWCMTANGVAMPCEADTRPRLDGADAETLACAINQLAREGVAEAVVEGEHAIAAAFEGGWVDSVDCWIEPALAPRAWGVVTAGAGVASMDEAVRLQNVTFAFDGRWVRVRAEVPRPG